MTRIRYKNVNGYLTSKPMIAGSETVVVVINTANRTVAILRGESEIYSATSSSVAKLKALAKKELKNVGVVFSDEVRSRLPF